MNEVLNNYINRITSNYKGKKPGGNIEKLMKLTAYYAQESEDTLFKMQEWQDIDKAEGRVLDRHGRNVSQERGQASDEVFRILIKSKIQRSLSDGSINALIDFLAFLLQIKETEVEIKELWQDPDNPRNAAMHINVPAGAVNATGLSLLQFGRLINLVVVAGVRAEVLFEGSFSFSDDYYNGQLDNAKGFANDEQTIGGTMGYIYEPAEDIELPI